HVRHGFEFLGYKIKRGEDPNACPTGGAICVSSGEIDPSLQGSDSPAHAAQRSGEHPGANKTSQPRRAWLGPPLQAAHVRKLFHPLDGRLVRRIWSHRFGKWRCCGWTMLPRCKLYGELGLVNLVALIPSIATQRESWMRENCTSSLCEAFSCETR